MIADTIFRDGPKDGANFIRTTLRRLAGEVRIARLPANASGRLGSEAYDIIQDAVQKGYADRLRDYIAQARLEAYKSDSKYGQETKRGSRSSTSSPTLEAPGGRAASGRAR
jgi:hypothetical protein